ncbi:hypothetical protein [Chelativorans sp.]|nr:hypothetical protein [Chelativorans sp.]
MRLSLGEWAAIYTVWQRRHDKKPNVSPPSEEEFDLAIMRARGVA